MVAGADIILFLSRESQPVPGTSLFRSFSFKGFGTTPDAGCPGNLTSIGCQNKDSVARLQDRTPDPDSEVLVVRFRCPSVSQSRHLLTDEQRENVNMKKFLRHSALVMGLTLAASTAALADPPWWHSHPTPDPHPAPEVDAGLAVSAIALLGGTLTVLRARARK